MLSAYEVSKLYWWSKQTAQWRILLQIFSNLFFAKDYFSNRAYFLNVNQHTTASLESFKGYWLASQDLKGVSNTSLPLYRLEQGISCVGAALF